MKCGCEKEYRIKFEVALKLFETNLKIFKEKVNTI